MYSDNWWDQEQNYKYAYYKIWTLKGINKFWAITVLLFAFNHSLYSQQPLEDNNVTNQLWISYNMSYQITETTDLYGEFGFKTISPNVWRRYYAKSGVKLNLPKIMLKKMKYRESLAAGIGFYYTDNANEANRLEIRPYQGYVLDWPDWTRVRLRNYFRLEERFDLNTRDWSNTFGLRFRYLIDATFKLQGDIVPEAKGIYIPASMEFFWNLIGARQFNDVYRTNVGIGSNFSDGWRLELRFGYQYARNTTTEDFQTNDIIYQIKAFYTIQ